MEIFEWPIENLSQILGIFLEFVAVFPGLPEVLVFSLTGPLRPPRLTHLWNSLLDSRICLVSVSIVRPGKWQMKLRLNLFP